MLLTDFNALTDADATALLRTCADVPWWADTVAASRPFDDVDALVAFAGAQAEAWGTADVEAALADHPRIGERHRTAGASADLSAREQSGVDPADAQVAARLAAGNLRYEQRFGRVFLVRAAGRSAAQMLDLLEQRLGNDEHTEAVVTAQQLREIATLRLATMVTTAATVDDAVDAPPVTEGSDA